MYDNIMVDVKVKKAKLKLRAYFCTECVGSRKEAINKYAYLSVDRICVIFTYRKFIS